MSIYTAEELELLDFELPTEEELEEHSSENLGIALGTIYGSGYVGGVDWQGNPLPCPCFLNEAPCSYIVT